MGDLQDRHGHLLREVSAVGFAERQWFRPGPGPRRPFPRRIRVPSRIRCRSRTCNFSECTRSGVCRELRCRQLRSSTYGPLRIRAPSRLQLVAEAARFKAPGFVCGDRRRLLQVLVDEGAAKTRVETAWINTSGLLLSRSVHCSTRMMSGGCPIGVHRRCVTRQSCAPNRSSSCMRSLILVRALYRVGIDVAVQKPIDASGCK